jgi:hypothetical protein
MFEQIRRGPPDGAGKTGDQRDAGDGIAEVAAVEAYQGREGGFIQPASHAEAQDDPGTE